MKTTILVALALVALTSCVSADKITINIKLSAGSRPLEVEENMIAGELKRQIEEEAGIKVESLYLGNQALEYDLDIAHYGVTAGSTLIVNPEKRQEGSYFGVDPNDAKAVEQRQKELSHEKFKELFGDEVSIEDMHFHHEPNDGEQKGFSLKEGLKKLFDFFRPTPRNE